MHLFLERIDHFVLLLISKHKKKKRNNNNNKTNNKGCVRKIEQKAAEQQTQLPVVQKSAWRRWRRGGSEAAAANASVEHRKRSTAYTSSTTKHNAENHAWIGHSSIALLLRVWFSSFCVLRWFRLFENEQLQQKRSKNVFVAGIVVALQRCKRIRIKVVSRRLSRWRTLDQNLNSLCVSINLLLLLLFSVGFLKWK